MAYQTNPSYHTLFTSKNSTLAMLCLFHIHKDEPVSTCHLGMWHPLNMWWTNYSIPLSIHLHIFVWNARHHMNSWTILGQQQDYKYVRAHYQDQVYCIDQAGPETLKIDLRSCQGQMMYFLNTDSDSRQLYCIGWTYYDDQSRPSCYMVIILVTYDLHLMLTIIRLKMHNHDIIK